MTRKLHTRTKIFFPNPHVVRLEYNSSTNIDVAEREHRQVCKQAYKLISGTWGYTKVEIETVPVNPEVPTVPTHVMGPNGVPVVNIAALFQGDMNFSSRAYFCFADELDLLQFRLTVDTRAIQVKMWPERWFTIHEVSESDDV